MTEQTTDKDAPAPLFSLNLGHEAGTFSPTSLAEIEAWENTEHSYWSWLVDAARKLGGNPLQEVTRRQLHGHDEILAAKNAIGKKPHQSEQHIGTIHNALSQRYQQYRAIASTSPAAAFIGTLRTQDPQLAASTLWAFMGNDPQGPTLSQIMGAALVAFHRQGKSLPSDSYSAAWDTLRAKIAEEIEALKIQSAETRRIADTRNSELKQLHTDQPAEFAAEKKAREGAYATELQEFKERLKAIEETYASKLGLSAPVSYFNTRARAHGWKAFWFSLASISVAGAATALAFWIAKTVFTDAAKAPSLIQISLTVIIAFLVLWTLRLLVRMLLSNQHLATDMRTRAMLMETYLALMKESGGMDKEDRARIIALLFRPTSDGLVRDDAAPPTPLAIVQDAITKNRN